jgi:hypothetical protein
MNPATKVQAMTEKPERNLLGTSSMREIETVALIGACGPVAVAVTALILNSGGLTPWSGESKLSSLI